MFGWFGDIRVWGILLVAVLAVMMGSVILKEIRRGIDNDGPDSPNY